MDKQNFLFVFKNIKNMKKKKLTLGKPVNLSFVIQIRAIVPKGLNNFRKSESLTFSERFFTLIVLNSPERDWKLKSRNLQLK